MKHPKPHKNLLAWQKAMDLVVNIYRITESFPPEERYNLTSQLRRAAVSVPSNIAEGAADRSKAQFINYLSTAIGSLSELDTQIEIVHRLNYVSEEDATSLLEKIDQCQAITWGLKRSIQDKKK